MTPARTDHFNGKTFFHPRVAGAARFADLLKWKFFGHAAAWPRTVEFAPPPPPPLPQGDEIVTTWIGHATFLLQTTRCNLLIDPVFSERASPVQWAGPRRVHPPGVAFGALPRIDAVLLSHDHYDHCDASSLARLAATHDPVFVAPLRHRDLLSAASTKKIVELDWWDSHALAPDLTVVLTPSQHWSNRFGTPRNHRLWGGFFLTLGVGAAAKRVWFVGDTGYDAESFHAIALRCGRPDLALIPIGAYEPRWFMAPMHMNPAEAVATHRDVGARRSIAMHWGTFQLTDEPREAPLAALIAARQEAGMTEGEFCVLSPGASFVI
jgi:L-ascorbate metabolism protein UlaG (beta-lactamase superfamily)